MTIKTLFRWHLWLGLISGIFLFLVGLTGAVAVFAEEIDWLVLPGLRAKPAPDGRRADADTLLASLKSSYPDGRVSTLNLSARPHFAHSAGVQVRQEDGRRKTITVFLDPATGKVQGEHIPGTGYTASVYQFIRQSHVRLLMGFWGRVFVGVLGVTLTLSCITGLWIYRGWIKKLFTLRLKGGWGNRPPWAELHKFVGVWSLLFNIVIGVTGAVLGLENLSNKIQQTWFRPERPAAAPAPAASENAPGTPRAPRPPRVVAGPPLSGNQLLARAKEAFPDLRIRTITFPARPDLPVTFRGGVPNPFVADSHVRSASSLALNGVTGEVVRVTDGRKLNFWRRVYWTFDPLHFGYFGGMVTKVIWFILGLTPSLLAVTGSWMWWRRRAHAARPAPRAPAATTAAAPAAAPVPVPRWVPVAAVIAALAGAYAAVAMDLNTWTFSHRFAEHWIVKPVALACAAFPVTILVGWLVGRFQARHRTAAAGAWVVAGAWFVFLAGMFPP